MNFSGVPAEYLAQVWPRVEPYLERACLRGGEYTPVDILKKLLAYEMQLWVALEGDDIYACCITEIITTPLRKSCMIFMGTGKHRERWEHFIQHIEAWAIQQGCQSMKVMARPGWERVFEAYKKTHSLLERDLTNG